MSASVRGPGGPPVAFRPLLIVPRLLRVFGGLVLDHRVPVAAKLIPLAVAAYVLFPLDLDWVPLAGWLDDAAVILLGGRAFVRFCPSEAVAEHVAAAEKMGRR